MARVERAEIRKDEQTEDLPRIMEVVSDIAAAVYGKVPFKEVSSEPEPHQPFIDRMGQVMDTTDDVDADIERLMDAVRGLPSEHQNNVFMYLGGYSRETLSVLAIGDVDASIAALVESLKPEVVAPEQAAESVVEPTSESNIEEPVELPAEVGMSAPEKTPRTSRAKTQRIAKPAVAATVAPVVADDSTPVAAAPSATPVEAPAVPTVRVPFPTYRDVAYDYDPKEHWDKQALCAQTDPEAFFPEKGGSTRDAKRICTTCDVRSQCLHYALGNDERFGIWGGFSERERKKVKRGAVDPDTAIWQAFPEERFTRVKHGSLIAETGAPIIEPILRREERTAQLLALMGGDDRAEEIFAGATTREANRMMKLLINELYPLKAIKKHELMNQRKQRLLQYFSAGDLNSATERNMKFIELLTDDLAEFSASLVGYRALFWHTPYEGSFADYYYEKVATSHEAPVTNIKPRRTAKSKPELIEQSA